ncbi:MAG TPA: protein-L-isoaspartate(D-aspartate) O-methyltransferase [Burkholderiales bacterium]|nr:protein-L-isoaspartate(D-aspartate) O-methyltransferase [Burkholderiales bacterium]
MPFSFSRSFSGYVRRALPALVGALATGGIVEAQTGDSYEAQRRRLVGEIAALVRETGAETGRAALSARVMAAMGKVPRHEFMPVSQRAQAYANRPLPIGLGQTISQPYIVALMSDLLDVKPGDRVLEVGTGSGYQAAVLAELAAEVYSIEIMEPLGREAAERLKRLGYRNVTTRIGDGYRGWPEHAPFDSIVVTAAPREVPGPLIEQLKPGGRLVVPVGAQAAGQSLLLIEKQRDGTVTRRNMLAVRFVPLTDGAGKPQ